MPRNQFSAKVSRPMQAATSPARRGLQAVPREFLVDEDDRTTTLQALVNILRRPAAQQRR
jgi:hypothetical protein